MPILVARAIRIPARGICDSGLDRSARRGLNGRGEKNRDEQSGEVGGLQNTATNLGASLGTALAGSVMIAILTASFITGIEQNPAVPSQVSARAEVELAGGIPFVSDAALEGALHDAGVSEATTTAVVDENGKARLDGLQAALACMALMALLALFFSGRIPEEQPGAPHGDRPETVPAAAT